MIVDDSEEDEEVSFVEDSINVKGEDLGVFGEHKCSEDEWKSSEEVEGNDFSEEGSYVDDSFKAKDENLRVFEDLGDLRRDECNEGETCVEDSITVEGENLGEIGGLDSIDFVGCGDYKRDDCSEEETYVEDSIKQKDEKSRVFREIGNVDTFVQDKVGSEGYVGCENNIDINDANQVPQYVYKNIVVGISKFQFLAGRLGMFVITLCCSILAMLIINQLLVQDISKFNNSFAPFISIFSGFFHDSYLKKHCSIR